MIIIYLIKIYCIILIRKEGVLKEVVKEGSPTTNCELDKHKDKTDGSVT